MPYIFSVSELTQSIKDLLEANFPFIWVKGQISNFSRATSGHIYFTLKDEQACLQIVWFKGSQISFDLQGKDLKKSLKDGQEIIVAGKLNVYPQRGVYQLIAEFVQEVGLGSLYLAFEALKQKLSQEGLFAESQKKNIPFNPKKVGIITAPNSAALQDFLKVSQEYGLRKELIIYPASVQGKESISELVRALEIANSQKEVEVLVLIRGGGSLEDLWSFNTEEVARAIFASKIPVITGIGHEVDVTIADLVADKRASTPSHVPKLLWPQKETLFREVDELEFKLRDGIENFLEKKEREYLKLLEKITYLNPKAKLKNIEEKFLHLEKDIIKSLIYFLDKKKNSLAKVSSVLENILNFLDITRKEYELEILAKSLKTKIYSLLDNYNYKLSLLESELVNSNPLEPLKKGYALVYLKGNKKLIKSIQDLKTKDKIEIYFNDGKKEAEII